MQCALPQLADTERAQRGTEAPGHTARMCCRRSGPCRAAQPPGAWGGARGPWYRISQAVFQQCFPSADSLSLVGGPSHPTELGKASPVPCYPPQGGTGGQPHRKPAPGEEGWGLCVLVGGGYKGCPRALPSEGHLPARTGLDKAPLPPPGNTLPQAWHCWPTTWLPYGGAEGDLEGCTVASVEPRRHLVATLRMCIIDVAGGLPS